MDIKTAIEKAVEGGYKTGTLGAFGWERMVLDPLFWQSLGKAMGWDKDKKGNDIFLKVRNFLGRTAIEMKAKSPIEFWEYKWHRFIDHLAEGKDAESYFESL